MILSLLAAPVAASPPEDGSCAGAVSAELDATVRGAAWEGESLYRLDVEAPGVVTLEVGSLAGARLGLLGSECQSLTDGDGGAVFLEESPSHLAFAVRRPGTFFLRVGAEDPRSSLAAFKLTTGFVEAEVREEEVDLPGASSAGRALVTTFSVPGSVTKDGVDPDPFRAAPGRRSLLTLIDFPGTAALKDEEHEVDPDPFRTSGTVVPARAVLLPDAGAWTALVTFPAQAPTKDEEHEVDPDPLRFGPAVQDGRWIRFASAGGGEAPVAWLADWITSGGAAVGEGFRILAGGALSEAPMLRLELAARCRDGAQDDHGDTFACATPVGLDSAVAAELQNGWGDDEDVFRFRLEEMRSVTIEAGFGVVLYDRFGQRLAGGDGVSRVVRTLLPGSYFVRVGGEDTGPYELTLASSVW